MEIEPGAIGRGEGFSLISNLGTSSIPFIENMTIGAGQVISAGPATLKMTLKDIWGRTWQQSIRTAFPDLPPILLPVKNFIMTITYEILKDGNQIYEWHSYEDVKIHLHIKLLNNYPKYFEIIRCKENQIKFVPFFLREEYRREYEKKILII